MCDADTYGSELTRWMFLVYGGCVMLMQLGFLLIETGMVSVKGITNILFKNIMDIGLSSVTWYIVGYAFAYGGDFNAGHESSVLLGDDNFAFSDIDNCGFAYVYYQYAFAATAVTSAMAERCTVSTYLIYSTFISAFIYPAVAHWVWSGNAWLTEGDGTTGYVDVGGSGVVHCVGGSVALVGSYLIGPRSMRVIRDAQEPVDDHSNLLRGLGGGQKRKKAQIKLKPIKAHSMPFVAMGGIVLFFGFLFFNGSVGLFADGDQAAIAALATMNTVLAGGAGMLSMMLLQKQKTGFLSLSSLVNGMLAGCVAICASCSVVHPYAAVIIGTGGGAVCHVVSNMVANNGIDDAVDAIAVHLGAGTFGVIATAFFEKDIGIFYNWDATSGHFLGWQLAGLVTIVAWSASMAYFMFKTLGKLGRLRISALTEQLGIDLFEHEEAGYTTEEPKEEKIEQVELIERRVPKPLSEDEFYELNRTCLVPRPGSIDTEGSRRSSEA